MLYKNVCFYIPILCISLLNQRCAYKTAKSSDSEYRCSLIEEVLETIQSAHFVPTLDGGKSGILNDSMLNDLGINLPTHWMGCNLSLLYKAEDDGYCLNTIYRKCRDVATSGGVLLIIRDTTGVVLGAVLSETIRCSKHYYGNGETYLFHWNPDFQKYTWKAKNNFFMLGLPESFQIGGQSGRNAIWFDRDLKYGYSQPTDTFDNPVLCGTLPMFNFPYSIPSVSKDGTHESQDEDANELHEPHPSISPAILNQKSELVAYPHHSSPNSSPFLIDLIEIWQLVN